MDSRIERLKKLCQTESLQSIINIPLSPFKNDNLVLIDLLDIKNNTISFRLTYIFNYDLFHFNNLPLEINDLISSYMYDLITIDFHVLLPYRDYLKPYIWKLGNIETTSSKLNYKRLQIFYNEKIKIHQDLLDQTWTPAMYPEKDILVFLSSNNLLQKIEY